MDKNRYLQIRSGKYTKTKVADIQRLYSKWLWLITAVYKPSFADAGKMSDSVVADGLIECCPDEWQTVVNGVCKIHLSG